MAKIYNEVPMAEAVSPMCVSDGPICRPQASPFMPFGITDPHSILQHILHNEFANILENEELEEIDRRHHVLVASDKQSVSQYIDKLKDVETEAEAITIAKKILNVERRNKKIDENERRIAIVENLILTGLKYGKITDFRTILFVVHNSTEMLFGEKYKRGIIQGAIEVALKNLVDLGSLEIVHCKNKKHGFIYDGYRRI